MVLNLIIFALNTAAAGLNVHQGKYGMAAVSAILALIFGVKLAIQTEHGNE